MYLAFWVGSGRCSKAEDKEFQLFILVQISYQKIDLDQVSEVAYAMDGSHQDYRYLLAILN